MRLIPITAGPSEIIKQSYIGRGRLPADVPHLNNNEFHKEIPTETENKEILFETSKKLRIVTVMPLAARDKLVYLLLVHRVIIFV